MQSMRPPESNQETSGLEPLSHTFAGPSRADSIVPNCGAKESAFPANFGLIFCRSIALLAPDSHRRHVCRCYRRCGPAPLLRTEESPRRSL